MFSLLLYLLFGIGQPSNSQPSTGAPTVQTADTDQPPTDPGDGGDKENPIPPKK